MKAYTVTSNVPTLPVTFHVLVSPKFEQATKSAPVGMIFGDYHLGQWQQFFPLESER